jgi:hypothetical protein
MLDKLISKAATQSDSQAESLQMIRLQDKLSISQKQISKLENRERLTIKHVKQMVDKMFSVFSPLSPTVSVISSNS